MNGKPIYASKTIIFNTLTLAAAALVALQNHELVAANPRAAAWVLFGVGVINAVLRLLTTAPIKLGE